MSLDRRAFLMSSTAALAGAGRAKAQSAKIRAAVLGTQHSHVRGKLQAMIDSPDYEVICICEHDDAVQKRQAEDPLFKGQAWVSESELLSDTTIDLVVVECKPWQAIPWGQKVIDAGKHLHLEKPAGDTYEPFKELVDAARAKSLLLQKGWVLRGQAGINAAVEAAKQGWLGHVHLVRATMNSDRGQTQRDLEARYPGGAMFELAGHMIDRVLEFTGRPESVRTWLRHDTGVDDDLKDNTLAVLEYDGGLAVVSTTARMYGSGDHRSFEVIGTDGTMMVQPLGGHSRMQVAMRNARGPYREGWQTVDLGPQPRYIADFEEFARAFKTKTPLKHSYDHELLVHETLLRASEMMG
ncbi:MAG: Gfo/Idh/MocA family oxidoreductase [Bryobacterales bacterium]|nr:Gfo/Idh/MocA family oxidoreductase [Bryobacterales bacterium]